MSAPHTAAAAAPSLAPAPVPRLYMVSAIAADGTAKHWHRVGGHSIDHAQEAAEVAGLGGLVRVVPVGRARGGRAPTPAQAAA